MRFLVFSDCHGDRNSLRTAIEVHPSVHTILFLGDGLRDIEAMEDAYPEKTIYKVCGNCDWASLEPTTRVIELNGKRIFMTHGHEYKVKFGHREAVYTARRNQCDLLLFGHTHTPLSNYDDGLYIMNPGSVSRHGSHSYGIVDITEKGMMCNCIDL